MSYQPLFVPNYALVPWTEEEKESKYKPLVAKSLCELTASELSDLCDNWRAEVFRRANKPDPKVTES
jgi:hypothetical protein